MELLQTSVLFLVFVLAWVFLLWRYCTHRPILPRQNPLRRARWSGGFVLAAFAAMFLLPGILLGGYLIFQPVSPSKLFHPSELGLSETSETSQTSDEPTDQKPPELQSIHPLQVFLQENPSSWKFAWMFLFAAVLVPITEEFLFRGILQGWLDARERELYCGRRNNGWRAMLFVAFLFALMHFRMGQTGMHSETLLKYTFLMTGAAYLFILVFGTHYLKNVCHFSSRETGWDLSHWRTDVPLGLFAFIAVAFPTFLLQNWLEKLFQNRIAPDPFALIPIALAFGILTWRTRRLLPAIIAHVSLNSFSILSAFVQFLAKNE